MITEAPQFFTATILEWKKLLKPDKYKDATFFILLMPGKKNLCSALLKFFRFIYHKTGIFAICGFTVTTLQGPQDDSKVETIFFPGNVLRSRRCLYSSLGRKLISYI